MSSARRAVYESARWAKKSDHQLLQKFRKTPFLRNAQGLTAEKRGLLENIREQTEKMEYTVDRILHMAALHSGRLHLQKEWVHHMSRLCHLTEIKS